MREQKMTISGLYRPGWHSFADLGQVPLLQLASHWLAEAGRLVLTAMPFSELGDLTSQVCEPSPEE